MDISTIIVGLITAAAAAAWGKIRGATKDTWWNTTYRPVMDAVRELMLEPRTAESARRFLAGAAWRAIGKTGLKRTALVERIVDEVVDLGMDEFEQWLGVRKQLLAGVEQLVTSTQAIRKEFDSAEARGRENPLGGGAIQFRELGPNETFEEIKEPTSGSLEVYGENPADAAAKVRAKLAKDKPPPR